MVSGVIGLRLSVIGGLLLGVVHAPPLHAQEEEIGIAVGTRPAPPVVEDLAGRPFDLGQVVGKKPVLLEFWATWCPRCAALLPKLEAAHTRFGDRVAIVSVAVAVNETPASVRRHLASHPIPFQFVWDGNGKAVRAFQAPATSYVVVLDSTGTVVYTGLGEDQDIEKALEKVVR
jgi:thiol-disulfide isomerase/thioredoxin